MFSRFPAPALLSPEPGAHPTVFQGASTQTTLPGVRVVTARCFSPGEKSTHSSQGPQRAVSHCCTHRAGGNRELLTHQAPGAAIPMSSLNPCQGRSFGAGRGGSHPAETRLAGLEERDWSCSRAGNASGTGKRRQHQPVSTRWPREIASEMG